MLLRTRTRLLSNAISKALVELAATPPNPDPYLHIPCDVCEDAYATAQCDAFPLALSESHRKFAVIAQSYPCADRLQLSTSVGTQPMQLYAEQGNEHTVFVQPARDLPPALWLPCKASGDALRRTLGEFASAAALHREKHHSEEARRFNEARAHCATQRLPTDSASLLRTMGWLARDEPFTVESTFEFHNSQEVFLGETHDPESVFEWFDANPLTHAIPISRTVVDLAKNAPNIDGPGVATALYRTTASKSVLLVQAMLSAEVRLPARDPEAVKLLWSGVDTPPTRARIGMFARAIWPDNSRMCGGGHVIPQFNQLAGTALAADMPVDLAGALCFGALRAHLSPVGVLQLRERVLDIAAQVDGGRFQLGYPSTADVPSPDYTPEDILGMHLQYIAHVNDPTAVDLVRHFARHPSPSVRMGAAKAALIAGDRDVFRQIVAAEPDGRNKHYLTTLVRRRKKRDLTDAEPRLLDEQFEFPAPLWTKTRRIDPSTDAGKKELHRLKAIGRSVHKTL
jgi:hypothetical protein